MEYRFIHHWQYEPGEEENRILESAVALSEKARNENLLAEIAAFLCEHTGVSYASIGVLSDDKKHVHTCAFLKKKVVLENITYALQGTPCSDVVTQRFCYFPLNVAQNFPDDKEMHDLQIDSYLGSLLFSEANEPLGLIALMDTKPIENAAFAEHLIMVLSPAIEAELSRIIV